MSKTLDAIGAYPHIAHVDDERAIGNSIIVTLKDGYFFKNEPACGTQGFNTVREARAGCVGKAVIAKNH